MELRVQVGVQLGVKLGVQVRVQVGVQVGVWAWAFWEQQAAEQHGAEQLEGLGGGSLLVPQGAAYPGAERGLAELALEIGSFHERHSWRSLDVVVPSGTGTTALFLARHVPPAVRIHAVPCVGGDAFLRVQMEDLDGVSGGSGIFPNILTAPFAPPFGAPDARLLGAWKDAASIGIYLDLVYGPIAWNALVSRWGTQFGAVGGRREGEEAINSEDTSEDTSEERRSEGAVVYLNCGGHEGIQSQLIRYERLGIVRRGGSNQLLEEVQRQCAQAAEESPTWSIRQTQTCG